MSRRVEPIEQPVGNDSFLDIVANIVGILIILIIVAGVRVSRAPVSVPPAAFADASPQVASVPPPPPPPLASLPAVVDRSEEITQLSDELAGLRASVGEQTERLDTARRAAEREREAVRQGGRRLLQAQRQVDTIAESLAAVRGRVASRALKKQQSRQTLDRLEKEPDPVRPLRHRLTPVGKTVRGGEQHFQVSEGRVVAIPLLRLQQRVRDQLNKHASFAAQFRRHEGVVGPIDGFTLDYTIQRQPLSFVDQLRHGRGMVRIGVTRWAIHPESDLETESVEEALRRGSRFLAALKSCRPGTTLTFWVYPDSFAAFRRLQSVAGRAGFPVAGRPLPAGLLISGSPSGTRSQAQ